MRVVIVEDSGLLRRLLVDVLTRRGLEVVGEAGSRDEAVAVVGATQPDVALLDIRMPPGHADDGLQAARTIRESWPQIGLLVLSHYLETAYAERLLRECHGGVGYLIKDRVQDDVWLIEAIRRVAAGEVVIDPDLVQRVVLRQRRVNPLEELTEQERGTLHLMAEGYSNNGIAQQMFCSVKTVEKRIGILSDKLGLLSDGRDRAQVNVRVLATLTYLRHAE
jgi:DNA-binding NarL/FixJ family response regulator